MREKNKFSPDDISRRYVLLRGLTQTLIPITKPLDALDKALVQQHYDLETTEEPPKFGRRTAIVGGAVVVGAVGLSLGAEWGGETIFALEVARFARWLPADLLNMIWMNPEELLKPLNSWG